MGTSTSHCSRDAEAESALLSAVSVEEETPQNQDVRRAKSPRHFTGVTKAMKQPLLADVIEAAIV